MSTDRQIGTRLVLDLDDTLLDTSSAILDRISILLAAYPVKEGSMYVYHLLEDHEREVILGKKYGFANQFWLDYESLRKTIRPRPIGNVREKLSYFSQKGHALGIVTLAHSKKVDEFLDMVRLPSDFFSLGIYTRDTSPYRKPDARCFSEVVEKISGKIVYIGDSLFDFQCSRDAGIDFRAVCTGLTDKLSFLSVGVASNHVFPSILEVEVL